LTAVPAPRDPREDSSPVETSQPDVRLAIAEADAFGTLAMLVCPKCYQPFDAPADSAGALIDCPWCPWTGTAGEPVQ
jgi:hypothetical protein